MVRFARKYRKNRDLRHFWLHAASPSGHTVICDVRTPSATNLSEVARTWPDACHACFGVLGLEVTEQTDEQLAAEAAREGSDGPAFVALVERFRQRVWRICFRLLGNEQDANDAAQEVFVRLFTQSDQVRRPLEVCHLGARDRGAHVPDDSPRTRTPTATRRHGQRRTMGTATADARARDASGLSLDLMQMLEILDEEDRAMLILKYAEGYDYEELAAIFDLSVSACKMRLSRAREKLQQRFPDQTS